MKNLFLSISFIFICVPVFAWNEKAAEVSLDYLNTSVSPHVSTFKKFLHRDDAEIKRINKLYKQNPKSIKTKEIHDFALACQKRNQTFLNAYENRYFKPAYQKYLEYDKTLSFFDWIHSIATSEISLFYDFYCFTESNLRDCEKIIELSANH